MCTVGYHKKMNLLFKNRDKNTMIDEVLVVRPDLLASKTEGADYYGLGTNRNGCAFVSTAVNTPAWTALASQGRMAEAAAQERKENKGLTNPSRVVSKYLPEARNVDELVDKVLHSGLDYMGYNLLMADREKAVHMELYKKDRHVENIDDMVIVTNHFKHLNHGPQKMEDYPNSFMRFEAAWKGIRNLVCLEDVFKMLKPAEGEDDHPFWRADEFFTVSSSVVDLETNAIYYTASPKTEYSRISGTIPPKGAEKTFIEMSRYIDLPTYHKIERGHPFYEEMIDEINVQVNKYHRLNGIDKLKTLEIGAGTGICSLELVEHDYLDLSCLELDEKCCEILSNHPKAKNYEVIQGDAVEYCRPEYYDLIISTFAHDHIHFDRRFEFAKNIYRNLKKGGHYIMGGEILPFFTSENERKKALFRYHNHIIELALKQDRVQLSELENNALKSGLDMVGDFKRNEVMFEEEMDAAGFKIVKKEKMGPLDRDDVGGVFVYVFEA